MKTFEHCECEGSYSQSNNDLLRRRGEEGWELVSTYVYRDVDGVKQVAFVFKREVIHNG